MIRSKSGQIRGECGTRYCYIEGCRCGKCKRANAEYQRRANARRAQQKPRVHGRSTYVNYGCRCDNCTTDHSAAMKRNYERRKATT